MATNFPGSKQIFSGTRGAAADKLNAPNHTTHHTNEDDTSEAVQDKLGTGASTPTSKKLLRGTGTGTSAWDKDAPTGTIIGTTDTQTLTNKTINSPTIDTATVTTSMTANNNVPYRAKQVGGTAKDLIKLGTDDRLRLSQLNVQDDDADTVSNAADSLRENILIQSGWGQKQGVAAHAMSETVTFPIAFDTILMVIISALGNKSTTAAADITELNNVGGEVVGTADDINNTNFIATLFRYSNDGADPGNFPTSAFFGYSWIAIGIKS